MPLGGLGVIDPRGVRFAYEPGRDVLRGRRPRHRRRHAPSPSSGRPRPASRRCSPCWPVCSCPTPGEVRAATPHPALVFQEPFLFADTLRRNIDVHGTADGDELQEALDLAQVTPFLAELPPRRGDGRGRAGREPVGRSAPARRPRPGAPRPAQASCCSTTPPPASTPPRRPASSPASAPASPGITTVAVASRPATIALADEVVYLVGGPGHRPGPPRGAPGHRARLPPPGGGLRARPWPTATVSTPIRARARRARPNAQATDTTVAADGTPLWGAAETVRRGWRASPELRRGASLTVLLAFVGTGGRLAVPILIQQAIDKGFVNGQVDMGAIVRLCAIGAVVITIGVHRHVGGHHPAGRPGRGGALRPADAGVRPHPRPRPGRPRGGAARLARRARHVGHRDAQPVLLLGRHRLAARRDDDHRHRGRDDGLRLAAGPHRPSSRPRRSCCCCGSSSVTSCRPTATCASATPSC